MRIKYLQILAVVLGIFLLLSFSIKEDSKAIYVFLIGWGMILINIGLEIYKIKRFKKHNQENASVMKSHPVIKDPALFPNESILKKEESEKLLKTHDANSLDLFIKNLSLSIINDAKKNRQSEFELVEKIGNLWDEALVSIYNIDKAEFLKRIKKQIRELGEG